MSLISAGAYPLQHGAGEHYSLFEPHKDGLGLDPNAELGKNPCLNHVFERDDVPRGRSARVDDRKGVVRGDTCISEAISFCKSGILNEPRRGQFVSVTENETWNIGKWRVERRVGLP